MNEAEATRRWGGYSPSGLNRPVRLVHAAAAGQVGDPPQEQTQVWPGGGRRRHETASLPKNRLPIALGSAEM